MLALLPADGRDPLVTFGEVPAPVPQPDEAVVAVEAFSINRGETFLLERPGLETRPGKDIAGRVVRASADGTGPPVGERVVGHPPFGGWAPLAAVPTDALAVLPATVDAVTAAALPLAGLTALRLLRACGGVAGQRILLTGASGGVGHYITELAAASGAKVTAVSASAARARRLVELGAAHVVLNVDDARGPFDLVLESVGGATLSQALTLLEPGGRLLWYGQASREPITLDFFAFFEQTGATIRHFSYEDSAVPVAGDLATLVRLVAAGRLHPELGLVADWTETAAALADLRERRIRGKAVLRVPGDSSPLQANPIQGAIR